MAAGSCSCMLGTCKFNLVNYGFIINIFINKIESKSVFLFFLYSNYNFNILNIILNLTYNFVLQLEVLELLVQNGADLNAKNKHDETPAGKNLPIYLDYMFYFSVS